MLKPNFETVKKSIQAKKVVKAFLAKYKDDENASEFIDYLATLKYADMMQAYYESIKLDYPEGEALLDSIGL